MLPRIHSHTHTQIYTENTPLRCILYKHLRIRYKPDSRGRFRVLALAFGVQYYISRGLLRVDTRNVFCVSVRREELDSELQTGDVNDVVVVVDSDGDGATTFHCLCLRTIIRLSGDIKPVNGVAM